MKEMIEKLIEEGLSTRQIAKKIGNCQTQVRRLLEKYQLKTKHERDVKYPPGHYYCWTCKEKDPTKFYEYEDSVCKKCVGKRNVYNANKRKLKLIDLKGGKCERCGYNKCIACLCFHHKDPSKKEIKGSLFKNLSFDKISKELDQCFLLCHNCHGEIHYGGIKNGENWFQKA